ncbi:hypothetical protein M413DRAFT_137738 [Hebeloma cylindrosporum]|uniref:Uncharacterized protein n=1 Tax=Hebeloma cylindrosporum TaxID=76867 RepID=A0A0C2XVU5_HEBCY|nr:hypothetical protein M413DRAFT_137738 [Hebeloma cylindrosporum h7]
MAMVTSMSMSNQGPLDVRLGIIQEASGFRKGGRRIFTLVSCRRVSCVSSIKRGYRLSLAATLITANHRKSSIVPLGFARGSARRLYLCTRCYSDAHVTDVHLPDSRNSNSPIHFSPKPINIGEYAQMACSDPLLLHFRFHECCGFHQAPGCKITAFQLSPAPQRIFSRPIVCTSAGYSQQVHSILRSLLFGFVLCLYLILTAYGLCGGLRI